MISDHELRPEEYPQDAIHIREDGAGKPGYCSPSSSILIQASFDNDVSREGMGGCVHIFGNNTLATI